MYQVKIIHISRKAMKTPYEKTMPISPPAWITAIHHNSVSCFWASFISTLSLPLLICFIFPGMLIMWHLSITFWESMWASTGMSSSVYCVPIKEKFRQVGHCVPLANPCLIPLWILILIISQASLLGSFMNL